jgi:DNA-binding transcriptional LysR family regulator
MLNNLNDIALFVAVVRSMSFRKAAEALDMPTSTLSRRISHLEKSIGIRLLHRTTRQIELTTLGRSYFERCQSIVENAQNAHEELNSASSNPSGLLRVSMVEEFGVEFLAPLLPEFNHLYPKIRFEFDLSPRKASLILEPVDIAIRMGKVEDSGLISRKITAIKLGLYASKKYLAKNTKIRKPEDLTQHNCLQLAHLNWPMHKKDVKYIHTFKNAFYSANSMNMMKSLVTNHLGIGMLFDSMAHDEIKSGELIRILPDWKVPEVTVFGLTESRLLPAKTRIFLDFLIDKLNT